MKCKKCNSSAEEFDPSSVYTTDGQESERISLELNGYVYFRCEECLHLFWEYVDGREFKPEDES